MGRGFSPGAPVLALGLCHPWGSAARAVVAKDGGPHVTPPCITGDGLCSAQLGLTDVPKVSPPPPHPLVPTPIGATRSLTGGSPLWSGFPKKLHLDCEISVRRPDPAVRSPSSVPVSSPVATAVMGRSVPGWGLGPPARHARWSEAGTKTVASSPQGGGGGVLVSGSRS